MNYQIYLPSLAMFLTLAGLFAWSKWRDWAKGREMARGASLWFFFLLFSFPLGYGFSYLASRFLSDGAYSLAAPLVFALIQTGVASLLVARVLRWGRREKRCSFGHFWALALGLGGTEVLSTALFNFSLSLRNQLYTAQLPQPFVDSLIVQMPGGEAFLTALLQSLLTFATWLVLVAFLGRAGKEKSLLYYLAGPLFFFFLMGARSWILERRAPWWTLGGEGAIVLMGWIFWKFQNRSDKNG